MCFKNKNINTRVIVFIKNVKIDQYNINGPNNNKLFIEYFKIITIDPKPWLLKKFLTFK